MTKSRIALSRMILNVSAFGKMSHDKMAISQSEV
jgi:hypothetical protein